MDDGRWTLGTKRTMENEKIYKKKLFYEYIYKKYVYLRRTIFRSNLE